jgi:membrane-bound ClpP family serine protease
LDPAEVRTVAFIKRRALADAALAALACDDLVMVEEAVLGGPGDYQMSRGELQDLNAPLQAIAAAKGRDWSLLAAMVDSDLIVYRCAREGDGEIRYFCQQELDEREDRESWRRGAEVDSQDGVRARKAEELKLARYVVSSFDEFLQAYHLEDELQVVETSHVVETIERLAAQPWFSRTLLFIAFFALISEASAPGLGVPGFISGLCFMLFFWCQFLNGATGWLEALLFLGGLTAVALEIFVIPGLGVFGIGGTLMILTSIVLASQTFVIPRNPYQFGQLPGSLFSVVVAAGGVVAALTLMRRFLPDAPVFNRMMLKPPEDEELEERSEREAIVDFRHLLNKRGVTITQLTPSGKASFGDERVDVISEGELVPRGAAVYVAEVRGNHVLVKPIEDGEGNS